MNSLFLNEQRSNHRVFTPGCPIAFLGVRLKTAPVIENAIKNPLLPIRLTNLGKNCRVGRHEVSA
jgi:hypothetical protein